MLPLQGPILIKSKGPQVLPIVRSQHHWSTDVLCCWHENNAEFHSPEEAWLQIDANGVSANKLHEEKGRSKRYVRCSPNKKM